MPELPSRPRAVTVNPLTAEADIKDGRLRIHAGPFN